MKRIINVILLIVIVSMIKIGVKAETFYEDNYLDNVYLTYKSNTVYKPQHMRYIRRTSDNKPVYCLTPSKLLYYDENYNINNNYNISASKLKIVSEIAYFGYGYKNHTSDKWYAITQYMIWKEMDSNHISFTDGYEGRDILRFNDEENEINNLISNYHMELFLSDMKIKYNESHMVYSTAFKNFNVSSELEITRNSEDSEVFIVKGSKKGDYKVNLTHKDGDYPTKTSIYTASRGQDIIVRGSIDRPTYSFNVNVSLGVLVLHKIPSDYIEDIPVTGTEYEIYDMNDNLVSNAILGEDGYSYTELKYGDYYVIETKNPKGYQLDNSKHYITVDDEYVYLDQLEDKIEVDFNLHKKLDNGLDESNITFDIYKNDTKIDSLTTNELGSINSKLTYGKYTLKQINTTKYYDTLDDISFTVDKDDPISLELTNHLIDSKLTINKLDSETKEYIINPTTFKIKDMINDKYIGDFSTLNGTITLDIKAGLYRLYEINEPYGYKRGNYIDFEVLDSNPVILNVYNEKIKEKTLELMKDKTDITIPNISKIEEKEIPIKEDKQVEEEIKTIYPKTSHIKESIVVSIVYVLFILGMYLYAKHKEK